MGQPTFGQPFHRHAPDLPYGRPPQDFIYRYLEHVSGPEGSDSCNINPAASLEEPSVYAWQVPPSVEARISRLVLGLIGGNPSVNEFAGMNSPLTNGILFQATDDKGGLLQSFHGQRPVTTNGDFVFMAGSDMEMLIGPGLDLVTVRFSFFKANANVLIGQGYQIRVVIQDDLSSISQFRIMVQGTYRVP